MARLAGLCLLVALGGCGGTEPLTTKSVAARPQPAPAAPAGFLLPTLGEFKGMGPPDLIAALGPPDFRRVEPPAEVWQYRGVECVIDFFLYRVRGALRVEREDARNRDPLQGNGACRNGSEVLRGRMAANTE
jgi:hypothetical protein